MRTKRQGGLNPGRARVQTKDKAVLIKEDARGMVTTLMNRRAATMMIVPLDQDNLVGAVVVAGVLVLPGLDEGDHQLPDQPEGHHQMTMEGTKAVEVATPHTTRPRLVPTLAREGIDDDGQRTVW